MDENKEVVAKTTDTNTVPAAPAPAPVTAEAAPKVEQTVQSAQEPAPQPQVVPQPANAEPVQPQVVPQPAQEPVPAPVQTEAKVESTPAQPVQATAPAAPAQPAQPATPVQPAAPAQPVQQAAPAPAPVQQPAATDAATPEVAPQAVAPVPPAGETIKETPALNPIANNPQTAATVADPVPAVPAATNNTVAPTNLANSPMDTNIGFVAVGENLKKKKNVPLRLTILFIILAAIGALGYFVVYPYVVKTYIAKPINVYSKAIDDVFKSIDSTVETIAHSSALYDAELQVDTNVESFKSFNGYTYAVNFGVDPENKNIQGGIRIKDDSSQEHSAFLYVKGDRQYLRLSSYRELIYMGPTDKYQKIYDEIYEIFGNINQDEYKYFSQKVSQLLKDSLDTAKLSKEDDSVTINNKKYKVLNMKYTIDSDTLNSMIKTVLNGIANDDKALDILSKNIQLNKDDVKKSLEAYDESVKIMAEGTTIVINIYTIPTKNMVVGYKVQSGDNSIHYYSVNEYFEYVLDYTYSNEETGKDEVTNASIVGIKSNGKTNVTIKYNEQQIAELTINTWDETTKDFKYKVTVGEKELTGSIKLVVDKSDKKEKITFNGSLNVGSEYVRISLTASNDWTSDVANINVATADTTLTDAQIEQKLKEFIEKLKGTPFYQYYSTSGGDIHLPANGGSKNITDCDPATDSCGTEAEAQAEPVKENPVINDTKPDEI